MTYFNGMLSLKITKRQLERIDKIMKKDNYDLYENRSHWIRCAIQRQIEYDNKRIKKS